jgi:hypothetical protein
VAVTTTDRAGTDLPPGRLDTPSGGADPVRSGGAAVPARSHAAPTYALASAGYLALSLLVWWNVWSNHPTSTTTCGCGDSSLFTWFFEWPAYAMIHGTNPLVSTAMFHPTGVNLLSNTGVVGLGVVLAPITWWFGPVASFNVALTLGPVLSALAMFVLLRRWTTWAPAAFAGGLVYGFSPFVLIALTDGHLMLGMAPVPPLVVACLDELLVRQRRRPVPTGIVLGVLVAVQFFIGSEVLVITSIAVAIGLVLVAGYSLWHRPPLRRIRHAAVALVSSAVTGVALLAYPVWFALAGPAHLSGPVWGPGAPISYGGTTDSAYLLPTAASRSASVLAHRFGGYQAPPLSDQYFGIGMAVVVVVGLVLWRRDLRMWLFAVVGALSVLLSFGLRVHEWTPWRLFVRLPLMDDVIPSRFLLGTYLCAAVLVGLIVDHARTSVLRWRAGASASPRADAPGRRWRWAGALTGVAVAALALVPWVTYYAGGIPLTTQSVVLPSWFKTVAPRLGGHQVLLAFPVPFALEQSAMTWQAVDRMHYAMAGGGGPDALLSRAGPERAGQTYLGNVSISGSPQPVTAQEIVAVRQALDGWGVTMVVLPDQASSPTYERVHLVRTTAVLMTAATGRRPIRQDGAWVWTGVDRAGPPLVPSVAALARCGAGPAGGSVASIEESIGCVVGAPTVTDGSADVIAPR